MDEGFEGFVVHAYAASVREGHRINLIGRLKDGRTFAAVERREFPHFHLRVSEAGHAEGVLREEGGVPEDSPLGTIDGERCVRVRFGTVQARERAAAKLSEAGVRTYEADIRFQDQFLMSRRAHGAVSIRGVPREGKRVDLVFVDPEIGPSELCPALSLLSLDIETDPAGKTVFAVGLVFREPWSGRAEEEVLFSGGAGAGDDGVPVKSFPDERSMLQGLCDRIVRWDPDIVTGWNVIDFDLRVIFEGLRRHRIPPRMGRSEIPAAFLPGERGKSDTVIIPGRHVLDAMRVVRAAPERFEDYTLETVSRSILGRGKQIELREGEKKTSAVLRMYRDDPGGLCRYCLEDARLVADILEKTGMVDLTVQRCLLLGVGLDRAWASIPAFEHLYIEELHARGFAAPTLGVDPFPQAEAPGGAILAPRPGLYDNVWVFDFKSLYPTIMRTFNIDPLSFVSPERAASLDRGERESLLEAPNGACFWREEARAEGGRREETRAAPPARTATILPALLERLFAQRDEAKRRGDRTASYVYKIVMNSFYGVLGARGSRFASGLIAGAITGFGQHLLRWCEDWFTRLGYEVLYGDTDSLFVLSGFPGGAPESELLEKSGAACAALNADLARYVEDAYRARSRLELEFDTLYHRFFLPPVRSGSSVSDAGEKTQARGRAKGYAGLTVPVSKLRGSADTREMSRHIEVVGMEAVRRDWTDLARGFQIGLLDIVFRGGGESEIRDYTRGVLRDLRAGALDGKLVYRKALRKPVGAYTRSTPPHVKAASMLDPEDRRGVIRYVWTRDGPRPAGSRELAVDYEHYVEKQLKPIAQGFTETLGTDLARLFGEERQLDLF